MNGYVLCNGTQLRKFVGKDAFHSVPFFLDCFVGRGGTRPYRLLVSHPVNSWLNNRDCLEFPS